MDRAEYIGLVDYLRGTVRAAVTQMPLGSITMDSASLSGVTSGLRVPSALGIGVTRNSALANDKYVYVNLAGATVATNV